MSTRKSITFSKGNAEWLADEANLRDYGSQTELMNELVRRERERQARDAWLSYELDKGYRSGRVNGPIDVDGLLSNAEQRLAKHERKKSA